MQVLLLKNLKSGRTWLPWESLPCQLGRSVLKNQELQIVYLGNAPGLHTGKSKKPKAHYLGKSFGDGR